MNVKTTGLMLGSSPILGTVIIKLMLRAGPGGKCYLTKLVVIAVSIFKEEVAWPLSKVEPLLRTFN